jgi:hypothetical protein
MSCNFTCDTNQAYLFTYDKARRKSVLMCNYIHYSYPTDVEILKATLYSKTRSKVIHLKYTAGYFILWHTT